MKNGIDQWLVDQIILEYEDHPFILQNNIIDKAIFCMNTLK